MGITAISGSSGAASSRPRLTSTTRKRLGRSTGALGGAAPA